MKQTFILSSGLILTVTGIAKLWSALGNARILNDADPLLNLQFGHLMFVAGTLELAIASVCLFTKFRQLAASLVAWLATNLLAYRFCLWWIGWHRPCRCLGNLTDALHIPPQAADTAMKIILAYLLIGSYATLFLFWRQRKKAPQAP
jgi:hypothetical protein